jgi:hypothetical protein
MCEKVRHSLSLYSPFPIVGKSRKNRVNKTLKFPDWGLAKVESWCKMVDVGGVKWDKVGHSGTFVARISFPVG